MNGKWALPVAALAFLAEPRVATLTTIRADGSLHAAPVRFTWDGEANLVRVLTVASSRKARNAAANPGSRVARCQVDGVRWVTLEGTAAISGEIGQVSEGVAAMSSATSRPHRTHRGVSSSPSRSPTR
jgi:PPOX class probable F420-dependent enzyme